MNALQRRTVEDTDCVLAPINRKIQETHRIQTPVVPVPGRIQCNEQQLDPRRVTRRDPQRQDHICLSLLCLVPDPLTTRGVNRSKEAAVVERLL